MVNRVVSNLRTKSPDQLKDHLLRLRKEAFNLRFQRANGQIKNFNRIRLVRREIAQVKTIISEKARAMALT
ncbi:ribosomal protein L29 [Candidatus Endolissoclinum faulkneri L2]|uniref:Large ribosomal subunit protein uL29 n=1 Tax=Candidatus Endolissoclinum faulkneri L2 TaxID=1193729 RepID=K7YFU1_9PROT|nr:50S ribosomal protein L29 [Candidatus Endolissoclinum faulkneri]AFX98430.1 ribosomal protein L29 [Candidatus Endolissoclinum faulkneri L2]